jgi:hypothetical protein
MDSTAPRGERKWKVGFRKEGRSDFWTGRLVAFWEVAFDPISDDYTSDEIDAVALFRRWAGLVRKQFPEQLIPIDWYIDGPDNAKFESAPFQYPRPDSSKHNFLTYYHWAEDPATGERLNWFLVPVKDKGWRTNYATKGGFIQEATGWKPSILQSHVYLPSLESALSNHGD